MRGDITNISDEKENQKNSKDYQTKVLHLARETGIERMRCRVEGQS